MNLSWITADLAIGGRITNEEAGRLGMAGIEAVIDLRSEAVDEAQLLRHQGIAFLHLPTDDHAAITPSMIEAGVNFALAMIERGRRLLVHCEHGIGRSATLGLCILVARGLSPIEALRLAKDRRELVSPSPAQYECWRNWLERRVGSNEPPTVPDFETFGRIAYRHLAPQAR